MDDAGTGPSNGTERVGFVGLGAMGGAIARSLIKGHTKLKVYDLRPEAMKPFADLGAEAAHGLPDLADRTIVITSLPGPPEFESTVFGSGGLADILGSGSLIIDTTSNDPQVIRRAARALAAKGIDLLDAPVAGGPAAGEQGKLAIAVGGSVDGFERARPLLEQTSTLLLHAGDAGCGDVCKLSHNLGIHIIRQALAEMFTVAVKAGVKPEVLFEFVSHGSFGRLDQLHSWFQPRILTGEFLEGEPTFRHALALKDIGLVVSLAKSMDVPLPLGRDCLDLAEMASSNGWEDRDAWITFGLQEQRAAVVVRAQQGESNGVE